MDPIEAVVARIDRLERECRRWRRVAFGAVLLAVTVPVLGGAGRDEVPRAIEAESFVLKDRSGNIKAVLGTWPRARATYLRFLDEQGQRLDLGLEYDGLAIVKLLGERRQVIRLEATPKGVGSVLVRGADGEPGMRSIRPSDPGE